MALPVVRDEAGGMIDLPSMTEEPQTLAEMEARRRAAEERIAAAAVPEPEPEPPEPEPPEPEPPEERLAAVLARHKHGERWLLAEALHVVCLVFQVKPAEVQGVNRHVYITHTRQIFMWLARRFCRFRNGDVVSFSAIARIANRDHTTAIYACQKISALAAGLAPPEDNPVAWAQALREGAVPVPIARTRRILELAHEYQLSRREIAVVLNCSSTTVNQALAA